MKKVLLTLLAVLFTIVPTFAATYNAASKVPTVGATLLTKNNIPSNNVKFTVVSGNVNNSNYASNKVINISSADLAYTGNDNEVAAVIANEIGHIISGHASKGKVKNLLQAGSNVNTDTNIKSEIIAGIACFTTDFFLDEKTDIITITIQDTAIPIIPSCV